MTSPAAKIATGFLLAAGGSAHSQVITVGPQLGTIITCSTPCTAVTASSTIMASVPMDPSQPVAIDWAAVDRTIEAGPDRSNRMLFDIARVMIAIRDGTWKPTAK